MPRSGQILISPGNEKFNSPASGPDGSRGAAAIATMAGTLGSGTAKRGHTNELVDNNII
jgi:hypothetical protein